MATLDYGSATRVSVADQAERDRERLRILRSEQDDQRYPADVRAAVGREISRLGAVPPKQDAGKPALEDGMTEPGNIDLTKRPKVRNADGSISTVRSMGVNIDGQEVLIPTVSDDGRIMGDDEAIKEYVKTGRHLGKFSSPDASNAYAEKLHLQQEKMYVDQAPAEPRQPGMLGLYQDQLEAPFRRKLANQAASKAEAESGSWSLFATGKALGGGVVSGGFDYAGSIADLASGAAAPLASTGGSAGGMFALPSDDERRQEEEARQRMLNGPAFDTTMGNAMRAKSKEFGPDPITSHGSAQIIHGLTSGVSKAAASALTLGPIPGAVVFGAEEGNTATQNLISEGVDSSTAAKVGAVTGVASAVSAAMPVAGKTLARTAGLVVAGGPASYVAQEALSKKILQDAGYKAQAEMHDPTDPVMLALSTVIPGAFGALALRGASRARARAEAYAKAAETQRVAADVRKDAARLKEAADLGPAMHDATLEQIARSASDNPAAVDAARVHVLDEAQSKHIPPDAPPGAERGIDAVRESVESGDMRPMESMASAQDARAATAAQETTRSPGAQRWFSGAPSGLSELQPSLAREGNLYGPGVYVAKSAEFADTYGRGEGRAVYEVQFEPQQPFNTSEIKTRAEADRLLASLGVSKPKIAEALGKKPKVANDTIYKALADGLGGKARANQALESAGYDAILFKSTRGDELAVSLRPVKTGAGQDAAARSEGSTRQIVRAAEPDPMPGANKESSQPSGSAEAHATDSGGEPSRDAASAKELELTDPEMLVTLPGHDTPMRLADAMEQIKAQADEMRQDGDLVKAAAQCALMSGV